MNVLRMGRADVLEPVMQEIFGADTDPMIDVDRRAQERFPGAIVWECEPKSFGFTYVSESAKTLGHARQRWFEPGFWATRIVHADDRQDAVDYCVLATAKCSDHVFEYRAVSADGQLTWMRDLVKVVVDPTRRQPLRLRGIMLDVTAAKGPNAVALRHPPRETLISRR